MRSVRLLQDFAGVPWSECQVKKTGDKSLYQVNNLPESRSACESVKDTHGRVYSHRLSYCNEVRKGGGFFYGKSSNENHSQGI